VIKKKKKRNIPTPIVIGKPINGSKRSKIYWIKTKSKRKITDPQIIGTTSVCHKAR
jgi:hypothetical protein